MTKRWLFITLGSLSIMAAIVLTIRLAIRTWDRIIIHGRAIIMTIFPFPTILYLLLLIIGVLLITLSIISWQDGIKLFDKGLVRRRGQKIKSWLYADTNRFDTQIAQVTFGGSMVSIRVRIILEDYADNCMVICNRYEQMPDLIDHLRALILPDLIAKSRQRLQLGENLDFHKYLQVNKVGLLIHGDLIPYETAALTFENQVVKLHEKESSRQVFFKAKLQQISNLDLLINLLENPPAVD